MNSVPTDAEVAGFFTFRGPLFRAARRSRCHPSAQDSGGQARFSVDSPSDMFSEPRVHRTSTTTS